MMPVANTDVPDKVKIAEAEVAKYSHRLKYSSWWMLGMFGFASMFAMFHAMTARRDAQKILKTSAD